MIYKSILTKSGNKQKQFALLIDPDKLNKESLLATISDANQSDVDLIFVGGSLVSTTVDGTIELIKKHTNIPTILFPGSPLQLSYKADGLLLLSLISGRNPDFLIGNHVISAPLLRQSNLEIISTGYMLIENGRSTSVEYISNTRPIPHDKNDIAMATAIAGEMLGQKLMYMDAGSGASKPISTEMIKAVKSNISIPLVIGGGIKTPQQAKEIADAGADIVVVGNIIEKNPELLKEIVGALK